MICATHEGDTTDYTYDTSGAVTNNKGDKNITYTYDAKGRLVKYVTRENGTPVITEYTYNYQGTRTSKTVNGKETQYVTYSMNGLSYVLYETDASGNIEAEYVRGCQLHTMTRNSETYVYLSDAHMDVRALADSEGNLVNRYRYDAWGNTLYAEEEVENSYRYCQEEYDAESGNTYLRARYYNATSANFLSADAYAGSIQNPMTLNKYAYAGANPVMYADPSGYSFTTFELAVRAAMENILIHMPEINVIGILSGGLSAIDTALSGEGDVVESFFTGYGLGVAGASFMFGVTAIPAIMLEVKMLLAVVQSVSIGFGLHFAGEAWDDGNVPLAVFRTAMVTVDMATFYMQFGPEIANGWKYYFGNAGGQSANAYAISQGGQKTVDVNGKTVTMDNSTFDPNFVDRQGRTNIQRMEQGLAPIGIDGKSVNIHHIDQTNNGPVMEITATQHQQNYSNLHTNMGQVPSQINRIEFNSWRREYWEWRSNNLD